MTSFVEGPGESVSFGLNEGKVTKGPWPGLQPKRARINKEGRQPQRKKGIQATTNSIGEGMGEKSESSFFEKK